MADFESKNVINPQGTKAVELATRLAEKPDMKRIAGQPPTQDKKTDDTKGAEEARTVLNKDDVVTEALQSLSAETKKTVANEMARALSPEAQAHILGGVQLPTQQIHNRVWQIIVTAFAIVFVLSASGLMVAAFWPERVGTNNTQILLTVVTTVAGILAGFISGRASDPRNDLRRDVGSAKSERIWLVIVISFAIVFVSASIALISAVLWDLDLIDIQILLTVVITTAGMLAGFISGRASGQSSIRT